MTSTLATIGIIHCDRCGGGIDTAKDTSFALSPSDPSGWRRLCKTCHEVHAYNSTHHPQPPISFFVLIQRFNEMYNVDSNDVPTDLGSARAAAFYSIIKDEIDELMDAASEAPGIDRLVAIGDLLGDLIVYCASEGRRWGIPMEPVLQAIMESNFSKLGADGQPILDERRKVLKGPNYFPPEPAIRALLALRINPPVCGPVTIVDQTHPEIEREIVEMIVDAIDKEPG